MRYRELCAILAMAVVGFGLVQPASAQEKSKAADTTKAAAAVPPATMTMKEAKEKLGIIVFPAKGQTAELQEADELTCLQWGADQAGLTVNAKLKDGDAAAATAAGKVDSASAGAGGKTAAKGAAVGAIIGSISGNAGQGAAYGAAGGAVAGRSARKQTSAQAASHAKAKAATDNKAKLESVRKAMTLCLESKGYTIK